MDYSVKFVYAVGDTVKEAKGKNEDFSFALIEKGNTLKLIFKPNVPIEIIDFYFEHDYDFAPGSKFFANGFQSWTDSKEFSRKECQEGLGMFGSSRIGKHYGVKYVGGYTIAPPTKKPGFFNSFSFAYIRIGDELDFIGSLDDRTGYTIISADMNENKLRYSKDVEGIEISKPYELLNLFFASGGYDEVFDDYFNALGIKPRTTEKIKGYTSWYNYYQNISESILLRDLEALCSQSEYVDTYQIDDGYEIMVGDWLSVSQKRFPRGLQPIVEDIHNRGFKAGLWLAPFAAEKESMVAERHPDWLVKNEKNKPVMVGHNWGGFYALDIYNEEARQYIKDVFNEVLNVWGFDMVKLDFLYCASAIPFNGKTRAEIAYDAVELLRECVGDKLIIGCGAPLMPCFGKIDYMRIGPDMDLNWKHTKKREKMHREDVSTPNALNNGIFRRCLNGRAFLNDGDVFLLRKKNLKYTFEQQKVIAKMMKLFSAVLFTSDDISKYKEPQLEVFKDTMNNDEMKLLSVNVVNDMVFIDYSQNGNAETLKFNISDGTIF